MPRYSNQIDRFIIEMRTGTTNTREDREIMAAVGKYGYDDTRMEGGLKLCEDLEQKHSAKKKEDDEQFDATRKAEETLKKGKARYLDFVKIGRRLYDRDETNYLKLGLFGKRKQSLHGIVGQATRFYETILSDANIQQDYRYFNISRDNLQDGFDLIKQAKDEAGIQDKEEAEAERATVIRDKAYEIAHDWWITFKTIARIALKDKPHLLEKIGITVS